MLGAGKSARSEPLGQCHGEDLSCQQCSLKVLNIVMHYKSTAMMLER